MESVADARVENISMEEYHERDAISSTMQNLYRSEGPVVYEATYVTREIVQEDRDHFRLGTAVHRMIAGEPVGTLIPREVLSRSGSKAGAAWKEFSTDHAGELLLKASELAAAQTIVESVLANSMARRLLEASDLAEKSIFWRDAETGLERRIRPDDLAGGAILDLKTTRLRNPDPYRFGKAAYDLGYHRQAATYREGVQAYLGEEMNCLYVIVSKLAPHCVYVAGWEPDDIDLGRRQVRRVLGRLADHYDRHDWRDPRSETVQRLLIPRWGWDEE